MPDDRPATSGLRKVHVSATAAPSLAGQAGATTNPQAQALLNEARTTGSQLLAEVALLDRSLAAERESQAARFRTELDDAAADDRQRRDRSLEELEAQQQDAAARAEQQLASSTTVLAPGAASRPWGDDRSSASAVTSPSSFQRIGTISQPPAAAGTPALSPLLNRTGWALTGELETTLGLIQATVARIVAQVPLKHLRLMVFDPKIEGRLGMFARLRPVNASTFAPPMSGVAELREALAGVVGLATSNAEAISASGVRDLGQLWDSTGMAQGAYTALVVLNYPTGLDAETNATLARIAETGAPRGVSLLVQVDPLARPAEGVDPQLLLRHLTKLTAENGGWMSDALPSRVAVTDDGAPPKPVLDDIVTAAISAASSQLGPEISLTEFIDESALWTADSIDSIDATIGRAGQDLLTLSLRSENPPHPNMLIGGAVGQGKSNLLLDIIYSLASRYSPDDLEMILLDFKRGLEFKRFDADGDGRNWLPHVRVLSLESDRPFGLAVLDHVASELLRRSLEFKGTNTNSITEYRRATGKPMSRMLLIIDEFQVLFDGSDQLTDDAVARLEELARQGRAFGIHLILGTQSVSGISGLRVKGETIFAQFPLRVSLKNTVAESQALFSRENTAPAELTYRGELVVNRNYGHDTGSNLRGVAALGSADYLRRLQSTLWAKDPAPRRPMVFIGGRYADWPAQVTPTSTADAGSLDLWLGMPMAVTDTPAMARLRRDVDQAVAVIGRGDEESAATLGAILATATASLPAGSRMIVLDGEGRSVEGDGAFERARGRGIDVQLVPSESVASYLIEKLKPLLAAPAGPPTLVVGLALQKIAELSDETLLDPDNEYGPTVSGASVLRELATRGGTKNLHFVGFWANVRTATEHLGYGHPGVGTYVLLTLGLEDLRTILGPGAVKAEGTPRAILLDRASDEGEQVIVPFAPVSAELFERWDNA